MDMPPKAMTPRLHRSGPTSSLVRQRFYASLPDMPVPLSKRNFNTYGASTTPTLVILNRAGEVAMYHPGAMPYEELRAALGKASVR